MCNVGVYKLQYVCVCVCVCVCAYLLVKSCFVCVCVCVHVCGGWLSKKNKLKKNNLNKVDCQCATASIQLIQ